MATRLGFYIFDYGFGTFAKMWLVPHLLMNNWVVMLTLVSFRAPFRVQSSST